MSVTLNGGFWPAQAPDIVRQLFYEKSRFANQTSLLNSANNG